MTPVENILLFILLGDLSRLLGRDPVDTLDAVSQRVPQVRGGS
jgi:hypothetical protein